MKISALLLVAFVAMASTCSLSAQDKYDLAVVGYLRDVPKSQIVISINGEKFEKIDVESKDLEGQQWGITLNPLIKQVNRMQNEGWEVVGGLSTSGLPAVSLFYYSLRKKR